MYNKFVTAFKGEFILKKNICMNMNKRKKNIHKKHPVSPADRILFLCAPLILLCLFGVIAELVAHPQLSAGSAAYYGGMLEYPIAALALLTGGIFLAERVARERK